MENSDSIETKFEGLLSFLLMIALVRFSSYDVLSVVSLRNFFSFVSMHYIDSFNIVSIGGVTTVVDMPLNNYPTTVSKETLELKVSVIYRLGDFNFF